MLKELECDGLVYIDDEGIVYHLYECKTIGKHEFTSDLVAIFRDDEETGFPVFVNWFAGASLYDFDKDAFMEACRDFIKKEDQKNG